MAILVKMLVRRVMRTGWLGVLGCLCFSSLSPLLGAGLSEGEAVVVVYNQNLPDSLAVAEHYAAQRGVPESQVLGLDLPKEETISRLVYREKLQRPLETAFRQKRWFEFDYDVIPATRESEGGVIRKVKKATVRYLALCFGVPLRIQADADLDEPGKDKIRIELRRNEAAVDSELALLPLGPQQHRVFGPLTNPAYGATNAVSIRPEMGVLMVSRLDGPTAEVAKGLVDLAKHAEEHGLWGRAYFDTRGLTSGEYKVGDDWIARAADFSRQVGIETYVDTEAETFSEALPVSHIGLYAGWYDGHVSGPFKDAASVTFMPGAIAYHLHSFSAQTVRSSSKHWVGPLLNAGAAATMGCVYEPYLALTPNLELFFSRLFMGFGFAEAAYASQAALSWQTTVVGDPLYRPFGKPLNLLQADLAAKKSPLLEWFSLMNINRALVNKTSIDDVLKVVLPDASVQMSPVLMEKVADLQMENGASDQALASYKRALELEPIPGQAVRLRLRIAALHQQAGKSKEAVEAYLDLAKKHAGYVGLAEALRDASRLAESAGDNGLKSRVAAALKPFEASADGKP